MKFGTRRPMYCICKVLFMSMSDSLSSVWGHSVHFLCNAEILFVPPGGKRPIKLVRTSAFSG